MIRGHPIDPTQTTDPPEAYSRRAGREIGFEGRDRWVVMSAERIQQLAEELARALRARMHTP